VPVWGKDQTIDSRPSEVLLPAATYLPPLVTLQIRDLCLSKVPWPIASIGELGLMEALPILSYFKRQSDRSMLMECSAERSVIEETKVIKKEKCFLEQ